MKTESINSLIKLSHSTARAQGWWDDLPRPACFDPNPAFNCPYEGPDPSGKWVSGRCSFFDKDLGNFGHCNCAAPQMWINDKIDLIAGEGAEAVEAIRNGRRCNFNYKNQDISNTVDFIPYFKEHIKDSLEDETADIAIRTMDLMGFYKFAYVEHRNFNVGDLMTTKDILRLIRLKALSSSITDPFSQNRACWILRGCLRIAELESFNLELHILAKIEYNKTRGRKHGKEF